MTEKIQIGVDTMSGDLRDNILTHIRAMETPWSKLSEREQEDKIEAASRMAETICRQAVNLVADKGFDSIKVDVGKVAFDKDLKIELKAPSDADNIVKLAEHKGIGGVLVLAEMRDFLGETRPALPDPDQPDLVDAVANDNADEGETIPPYWTDDAVRETAEICHERNTAYCRSIGDDSQTSWDDAPDWQVDAAIEQVLFHVEHGEAAAALSHQNWMQQKLDDGWVYGEEKDAEAKTHPCLVPFDQLPEEQKLKDVIFGRTVRECGEVLAANGDLGEVSHDFYQVAALDPDGNTPSDQNPEPADEMPDTPKEPDEIPEFLDRRGKKDPGALGEGEAVEAAEAAE